MPRKTAHGRRGASQASKKLVPNEDVKLEQEKPRKNKGADNLSEGDRARRSSTAAQTAASAAESRGTRNRTARQDSSDSQRTSVRDTDSVRSSRRAASRVNYKESDGEEEVPTSKNDENIVSDEGLNASESDEQRKSKKGTRSPPKPVATPKQRGRGGRGASRVKAKPSRKKAIPEEPEEDDDDDVEALSDQDEEATKKETSDAEDKGRRSARSPTKAPVENAGRKSSRARSMKTETPVSRRPSRNTKVKKYTEVEEDFDDEVKSEEEQPQKLDKEEKKTENEYDVKDSRKRKRESEYEPNKRSKKEESEVVEKQAQPVVLDSVKGDQKEESIEEPMEVDESISEVDAEKKDDVKPASEAISEPVKESVDSQNTDSSEMLQTSEEAKTSQESSEESKESNHVEETVDSLPSKKDVPDKMDSSVTESKGNTPGVIKSIEKEVIQTTNTNAGSIDEGSKEALNCTQSILNQLPVQDTTFLPKEQISNSSLNGQSDKSVICESVVQPEKPSNFHYQNSSSTPPKENGAHGDHQRTYSEEQVPGRSYVENPRYVSLTEGQRANSYLHFGCVSCNLFLSALKQDKLVHELDKNAEVICIQNVSKSLFYDVLERNFDALGFKAATCWASNSETGLVTFYKTSVFRLNKAVEIPVRTLVEKRMENSDYNDVEKSAAFQILGKCGNVLLTEFASVNEDRKVSLRIANVKIPSTISSLHALQFMCLSQELVAQSDQFTKLVMCGEFNTMELELPYQILKHGKLNDHLIDELKSQVDSAESAVAVKIISNSLHLPSLKLTSCYQSVLGEELTIPESKTTSPELLFTSGEDIHTAGVLDFPSNYAEQVRQGQIPLKANIAIALPLSPKEPV